MNRLSFSLLRIGFFLIPLESLGVTFSRGWNCLAYVPILISFALEAFYSRSFVHITSRLLQTELIQRLAIFFVLSLFFSSFSYLTHGIPSTAVIGELLIKIVASLSLSFLLISFEGRHGSHIWNKLVNALLAGYICSILIHLTSGLGIPFLLENARRGTGGQSAFTFTEPSFISVHLYYVLLVLIAFPKFLILEKQKRNLCIIFGVIFLITLASQLALRPVVDIFFIAIITFILYLASIFFKLFTGYTVKRKKFTYCISLLILFGVFYISLTQFERFSILMSSLINKDISMLATIDVSSYIRIFSIDVMLPRLSYPYEMFFGYGVGNVCSASSGLKPLIFSYPDISKLTNISEINSILVLNCVRESFSMIIALVAETGIPLTLFFFGSLFSRNYKFIYSLLIVSCIQFDSFALYIFPLYSYLLLRHQITFDT